MSPSILLRSLELASQIDHYRNILRARFASRWIEKIRLSGWTVLELGRKETSLSFPLPRKRIKGGKTLFLEASAAKIPAADLVVFVGIADRMATEELSSLISRIPSRRVLFSFREPPRRSLLKRKNASWRGVNYHQADQVRSLLEENGFKQCEVRSLPWFDPTKLVLAQRPQNSVKPTP